jgi:predicted acetyltransferase
MSPEIRGIGPDEIVRFRQVLTNAFGSGEVDHDWDATWENVFETDRLLAAEESGEMVGVGGSFSFQMTVPGGEIATAGLTVVGVLPTHRRRGVLGSLMKAHIEDARARRESVSILWASEEIIYQRFGYGLASTSMRMEVDRGHGQFRNDPGPSGRTRLLDENEALKVLPDIYDRVRESTPGMLARSSKWWQYHRLWDPKSDREGASPFFRVVWESEGQAEAYALYRVKESWDELTGLNDSTLWVWEAASTSPEAHRELWRYVFSVDLIKTVTAFFLAADDPLPLMVLEPRRLRQRQADAVWLRVIDVGAALEERGYAADGELTFELTDAFCPWNEGRWTLTASGGTGRVVEASGSPDLAFDACDIGSAYLGGISFDRLMRAGRVRELRPGAVARADALFRSARLPWHPEIF